MKPLGSKLPSILTQRANWLRELNLALHSVLPKEYHEHVKVASLHRNLLTLEVDSPAWATNVRYCSHDISSQLSSKTSMTIESIKIHIQPFSDKPVTVKRKPLTISGRSAQQFKSLAKSIQHPGLKQALSKLAKRSCS